MLASLKFLLGFFFSFEIMTFFLVSKLRLLSSIYKDNDQHFLKLLEILALSVMEGLMWDILTEKVRELGFRKALYICLLENTLNLSRLGWASEILNQCIRKYRSNRFG